MDRQDENQVPGRPQGETAAQRRALAEQSPLLQNISHDMKRAVASRMCIPETLGFCYFRIPKAANSTIIRTLATHLWNDDVSDVGIVELKQRFSNFHLVADLAPEDLLESNFCWTFVRNPFGRVLSAYFSKIKSAKFLKRYYADQSELLDGISFSDYLRVLRDEEIRLNPHWAPQMDLLPVSPDRLHVVGRVESIDTDLPPIIERLTGRFDKIQDHVPGRRGTSDLLKEHYGEEDRRIVRDYYARDFEVLYPDADGV